MKKELSLWQAISIGIGSMIGASIFTIFGLGVKIAGKDLPEAFLLSGLFALMVAYSYSYFSNKIVSNAGPIEFILKGLGDNIITGALSILMWLSYVVSISLFAKGFTDYFLPLFGIEEIKLNIYLTEIILILFFTLITSLGSKIVGKAEEYLVIIKLLILGLFIVIGFFSIKIDYILPTFTINSIENILYASVVFFLSYMGFGLITNASENIKNPKKNVPLAIFLSILIVIIIYILISLVTIGNMPLDKLIKSGENILAIVSMPFLGRFGFILVSIGALFSIASALNATIYGGANIAYSLAKDGELPKFFERKTWFKSTEGLLITSSLALIFVLLFDIGSIALITSSIYTIIYLFVIISHFKIRKVIGGNKIIIITNMITVLFIFILLMRYQFDKNGKTFYTTIFVIIGALIIESLFRLIKNKEMKHRFKFLN